MHHGEVLLTVPRPKGGLFPEVILCYREEILQYHLPPTWEWLKPGQRQSPAECQGAGSAGPRG